MKQNQHSTNQSFQKREVDLYISAIPLIELKSTNFAPVVLSNMLKVRDTNPEVEDVVIVLRELII